MTSALKPHKNEFVRNCLAGNEYLGLVGELIVGSPTDPLCFNKTTGPVRRKAGEPNFKLYAFDTILNKEMVYEERWITYMQVMQGGLPYVEIVPQVKLTTLEEVLAYEETAMAMGFEGLMLRSPHGDYKEGRTTLRDQNLFKRKPVEDCEATIIGFVEQMENKNIATINELGNTSRSTSKENLVPKNTLGALVLHNEQFGEFNCGTGQGLTKELRKYIWDNQELFMGETVTVKYQGIGTMQKPRQPIVIEGLEFKGFRDPDDITKW